MTIEIIAEIAQGFEGVAEQARLLMKAASSAGADAAKYQLVYADELATTEY
jgi:sialic acid synthase SpsE